MDIGPHQFHFMAQQVPTELKEKLVQPVQVDPPGLPAQKVDLVVLPDLRDLRDHRGHRVQSVCRGKQDLKEQRVQSVQPD